MIDIQYSITIISEHEVSLPNWFFAEGERFLSFCRCHRPQEVGVGDVVWLIQAPAWNQTCRSTNDKCEALASAKGCFLCFCFCAPVFIHWTPLTAPLPKRAGQPIGATHLQVQPKSEAVSPSTQPRYSFLLPTNHPPTHNFIVRKQQNHNFCNFVVHKW